MHSRCKSQVTPQREVAQLRQVVVKFDTSAVNFGDRKAAAPRTLSCSNAQATKGKGRWISDRESVFAFENDLPPGVNCTLQVRSGFKPTPGALLTGVSSYKFDSCRPFIQNLRPGSYEKIDEKQYFLLQLNGAATLKSIEENVWCSVEGLGERDLSS